MFKILISVCSSYIHEYSQLNILLAYAVQCQCDFRYDLLFRYCRSHCIMLHATAWCEEGEGGVNRF